MSYAKVQSIKHQAKKKAELDKKLEKHAEEVRKLRANPDFQAYCRKLAEKIKAAGGSFAKEDLEKTFRDLQKIKGKVNTPEKTDQQPHSSKTMKVVKRNEPTESVDQQTKKTKGR